MSPSPCGKFSPPLPHRSSARIPQTYSKMSAFRYTRSFPRKEEEEEEEEDGIAINYPRQSQTRRGLKISRRKTGGGGGRGVITRGETSRGFLFFSRRQGEKKRALLKYAYCALSSRRPFKGLPRVGVASSLCARSFRPGDKNFSPRADTPDAAAGEGPGTAAVTAACNYLLMTHKPAIFSRRQASEQAGEQPGVLKTGGPTAGRGRRGEGNFPPRAPRPRHRSVRNHRSVWRQVLAVTDGGPKSGIYSERVS